MPKEITFYVFKTDISKMYTFTFGGTSKRTKSFGEESMFPNQYDSQKRYMCYVSSSFPTRNKMSN